MAESPNQSDRNYSIVYVSSNVYLPPDDAILLRDFLESLGLRIGQIDSHTPTFWNCHCRWRKDDEDNSDNNDESEISMVL